MCRNFENQDNWCKTKSCSHNDSEAKKGSKGAEYSSNKAGELQRVYNMFRSQELLI